jgi:hypothetical protein
LGGNGTKNITNITNPDIFGNDRTYMPYESNLALSLCTMEEIDNFASLVTNTNSNGSGVSFKLTPTLIYIIAGAGGGLLLIIIIILICCYCPCSCCNSSGKEIIVEHALPEVDAGFDPTNRIDYSNKK